MTPSSVPRRLLRPTLRRGAASPPGYPGENNRTCAMPDKVAIAIGAHPDDIEFYMAGTLLMLKKAGYETHYMTVANGNCGSVQYSAAMTRSVRNAEARAAAKLLDADFH